MGIADGHCRSQPMIFERLEPLEPLFGSIGECTEVSYDDGLTFAGREAERLVRDGQAWEHCMGDVHRSQQEGDREPGRDGSVRPCMTGGDLECAKQRWAPVPVFGYISRYRSYIPPIMWFPLPQPPLPCLKSARIIYVGRHCGPTGQSDSAFSCENIDFVDFCGLTPERGGIAGPRSS